MTRPTILIPVRPFASGKSRLIGAIEQETRWALNARLFTHVLAIACRTVGADRCLVISRSGDVRLKAQEAGARAIAETGGNLNAALDQGRAVAVENSARTVVTLSTDLPFLEQEDLEALIDAGRQTSLVVASDLAGIGTNALLVGEPAHFRFRYGADSCRLHRSQRPGSVVLMRRGLACDLDEPEDLKLLVA